MRKTIKGFRMDALIAKHIESIFLNFDLFLINIENHENSANESKIYILSFCCCFFFLDFLRKKRIEKWVTIKVIKKYSSHCTIANII
jgi:hypothetical protein